MTSVVRSTALRAGGACVRCRKGKTKCVYENGRAPCKNCAKGMHECYLPSESMAHGGHSPANRVRPRESLPDRSSTSGGVSGSVQSAPAASTRHMQTSAEKLTPELMQECERVISKTLPSCVAFHKPSFLQQLKNATLEPSIVNGLLTCAARTSPVLIRRYGGQSGATGAAEHFAVKTINVVMQSLDSPSLADIQALCLLIIHEWGCRNAVRAYIYLGQAARMAQMYRIVANYRQHSEPDQFLQDESFRRTVWLIFILDCFLTSSPGRVPALAPSDFTHMALPCLDMNYHFGSPVHVRTLDGSAPRGADPTQLGEVGEFGHIVLATRVWRQVVEMLTSTTIETFSEEQCASLEADVEAIRQSLPVHFMDKQNQINLHITMGSGYTYAFIHCLLHCAVIFVNRRRLLQLVTSEGFSVDNWPNVSPVHHQTVDRVFAASHSIIAMLTSLEIGADKDSLLCFPIFMLFSAFTASSTVAYLSLKGLTPSHAVDSAAHIVREGLRFLADASDSWPLVSPWHRHLAVMSKVLKNGEVPPPLNLIPAGPPSVKDEGASPEDTTLADGMDYEHASAAPTSQPARTSEERGSEPPPVRRTGITTINGGSTDMATPRSDSPAPETKHNEDSPEDTGMSGDGGDGGSPSNGSMMATAAVAAAQAAAAQQAAQAQAAQQAAAQQQQQQQAQYEGTPQVDMTPGELCSAFEHQLLELDDLAAFMGGGV